MKIREDRHWRFLEEYKKHAMTEEQRKWYLAYYGSIKKGLRINVMKKENTLKTQIAATPVIKGKLAKKILKEVQRPVSTKALEGAKKLEMLINFEADKTN